MEEEGLEAAVMVLHDMIALPKGLAMVDGGLALFGIIGHHHLQVEQRHIFFGGSLHHADTPVDIGRIAVAQIVRCGDSKIGAGIKSLMADEHALTEGLPRELLWWG